MTDYKCCRGHTDVGHHSDCPQRRQAVALEEISHKMSKILDKMEMIE